MNPDAEPVLRPAAMSASAANTRQMNEHVWNAQAFSPQTGAFGVKMTPLNDSGSAPSGPVGAQVAPFTMPAGLPFAGSRPNVHDLYAVGMQSAPNMNQPIMNPIFPLSLIDGRKLSGLSVVGPRSFPPRFPTAFSNNFSPSSRPMDIQLTPNVNLQNLHIRSPGTSPHEASVGIDPRLGLAMSAMVARAQQSARPRGQSFDQLSCFSIGTDWGSPNGLAGALSSETFHLSLGNETSTAESPVSGSDHEHEPESPDQRVLKRRKSKSEAAKRARARKKEIHEGMTKRIEEQENLIATMQRRINELSAENVDLAERCQALWEQLSRMLAIMGGQTVSHQADPPENRN